MPSLMSLRSWWASSVHGPSVTRVSTTHAVASGNGSVYSPLIEAVPPVAPSVAVPAPEVELEDEPPAAVPLEPPELVPPLELLEGLPTP